MTKVLISFLGTGPNNKNKGKSERVYNKATYKFADGTTYDNTSFVADAIARYYHVDRIIMIGTAKSMWEHVYEVFCENKNQEPDINYYTELATFCDSANAKTKEEIPQKDVLESTLGKDSHIITLQYGINQCELNGNAAKLLGIEKLLHKNDELIFDITHSFRSLPLYMMNLLIYLRNVSDKNVSISHILYGMLEASELGYAPVVDLVDLLKHNDWIVGAYSFKEFGNSYKISELMRQEGRNDIAQRLNEFSEVMNLNYIDSVKNQIGNMYSMRNMTFSPIPNFILPQAIKQFTSDFKYDQKDSSFQYAVARWQYLHKKYSSSYLSLTEAIVTYVEEKCEIDSENDIQNSEIAKVILGKPIPDSLKGVVDAKVISEKRKVLDKTGDLSKLVDAYKKINHLRNKIAHQQHSKVAIKTNSLINVLNESINILAPLFESEKIKKAPNKKSDLSLLINLSNHPSTKWSEEQLTASINKYGKIIDLPFPAVEPDATNEDIMQLAITLQEQIRNIAGPEEAAIHIMGELSLTYALVNLLKTTGYSCIASTSYREVYEEEPGKKTIIFKFVRFREY